MVDVVNVVGSGSLPQEFDLPQISGNFGSKARYDPEKYSGMYLELDDSSPLITLYRTGKYIITGADSKEEAYTVRDRFLQLLTENGIINEPSDNWFKIQNYVCTAELGHELNLNALAIGLGLEDTEYEPEQFPGLIYRSTETENVVLLFASGKIVITGSLTHNTAKATFKQISRKVEEVIDIN